MVEQLGFRFDDQPSPSPVIEPEPVDLPEEELPEEVELPEGIDPEPASEEDWWEPTGIQVIKKGNREFYKYRYEKGAGRFVNTNRFCVGCSIIGECYAGKHSCVPYCGDKT